MDLPKYSTKQICDLFDIGRETLRHYENIGLLHPAINPDNGYREYSYWDIATIMDTLKYKSEGIALSDIDTMLNNSDFQDIIDVFEQQNDRYINQLLRYKFLQKKTALDLSYLKHAVTHLGEIQIVNIFDLFIVPYTHNTQSEYFPSLQKAFHNSEFFSTIITFKPDIFDLNSYGMVTERLFADYLKIEKGIDFPSSKVACEMLDYQKHEPVDFSIAEDFKKKVRDIKNINLDTIYAILMTRFYDKEKRYHQFFFVFAIIDDTL